MTPRDRSPRHGEAGFVLIGVVIFVLALTIIGISLFSLSSYEAQFLQRSIDEEQAFQSAMGGIERAKFVLARTSLLQRVEENLPDGVDSTVAVQDGNSTGTVKWDSTDVITIRVIAQVNGARRTIEGAFTPSDSVALSYYSSLLTLNEGIKVEFVSPLPDSVSPKDRDQTVLLGGPVWEDSTQITSLWLDHLMNPVPVEIRKSPRVPVPDVAPFLTRPGPIDGATLTTATGAPANPIILDASATPGIPAYFHSERSDPNFSFNSYPYLSPQSSCTIQVRGLAVWLLPYGAMFYQGTVITGDPATACLVVIAGPMTGTFGSRSATGPTSSICFLGSLQADIPVILVSSGEVLLWHENDWDENTSTIDVAIFARSARFMGPDAGATPPLSLRLLRDPSGPLNKLGGNPGFLDAFAAHGALPNASSGGRRLDLIPGTWQASDR